MAALLARYGCVYTYAYSIGMIAADVVPQCFSRAGCLVFFVTYIDKSARSDRTSFAD